MRFYLPSEIWSKIQFACVTWQGGFCRGNAWLHCRIEIHSPHLVGAHCSCITRLDEQLLCSFLPFSLSCAAKALDLQGKSFFPSSGLEGNSFFFLFCFLKGGWWVPHYFTLGVPILLTWKISNNKFFIKYPNPTVWLAVLSELLSEAGCKAVGSPVLFQSKPSPAPSQPFLSLLKVSRTINKT